MSRNADSVDFKSQVLAATDIVQLIGGTVALKRTGRDYAGLCPFHQEKTPSFHVKPDRQFFYCFGCKAGGNAIDFVMRRDRIDFVEAMKHLGEIAGLEMPRMGLSKTGAGERQQLLDAQSAAASYFSRRLQHPTDGQAARDYLQSRGFTAESIRAFQLGVAANAWDGLLRSPTGAKLGGPLLAKAGLVKARDPGDGFYDTFRDRLMFPIRDENARIIAFGGRVMPGSSDPAKYLNSPETLLFSKSRCIYGLDLARQRIVESRVVAVVEGYTDVIMAHQCGATNVVSVLGTALTAGHVAILRRFADKIVLLFDPDTAGDLAVDRAVELLLIEPVEISIATMPEGLDPDEYLLKYGAEAFDRMINSGQDALEYKWKQLIRRFSQTDELSGQTQAVQAYLEVLSNARAGGPVDDLRWGAALTRVSRLTEIPVTELNRRFQPRRRPAAAPGSDSSPQTTNPVRVDGRYRAERWILGVLLVEPTRWLNLQQVLSVKDFTDPTLNRLAEALWVYQREEGNVVVSELLSWLPSDDLKSLVVELADEADAFADPQSALDSALALFAEQRNRAERDSLAAAGRKVDDRASPLQESDDLLTRLSKQASQPDLRRMPLS